jgi:hypothetical protein
VASVVAATGLREIRMNPDVRSGVKDARILVAAAIQSALLRGIIEDQLMYDSAVRAAYDHLTQAQTTEHLRVLRERHKESL